MFSFDHTRQRSSTNHTYTRQVFGRNRLQSHAPLTYHADAASALRACPPSSPAAQALPTKLSLDGTWRFHLSPSPVRTFTTRHLTCTHTPPHMHTHATSHAHTRTHTHTCTRNSHTHAHMHTRIGIDAARFLARGVRGGRHMWRPEGGQRRSRGEPEGGQRGTRVGGPPCTRQLGDARSRCAHLYEHPLPHCDDGAPDSCKYAHWVLPALLHIAPRVA